MTRTLRLYLEKVQELIDFETESLISGAPENIGAVRHSLGYIQGMQRCINVLQEVTNEEEGT